MVKGVNKTVIEVNNTGSKFFEKIVFYVTPQYGNLSAKRLSQAASEISFRFEEKGVYAPLRVSRKRKLKKRVIFAFIGTAVILAAVLLAVFL